MTPPPRRGLYAITDAALLPADRLIAAVAEVVSGGAVMVQFRDKVSSTAVRRYQARALADLCRERTVPLIINDDVLLAKEVGADGVHLGRNDTTLAAAREALGVNAIIGISCYNEPERALRAQADGASYVAFGCFYPSSTKPHAVRASPAMLHGITARLSVPVAVIGGITPENGASLVGAGADLLAVISGVFDAPQPRAAAEAYSRLFQNRSQGTRENRDSRAGNPDAQ